MSEQTVTTERPWALGRLPPFPVVANRVLSLVNGEDVAAGKVSEIVQLDPAFTAELLRVANSALFGVVREVSSVRHAVSLLGLDRVKAMATLIALNAMVKPAMRLSILRKFWVHSLVTAIVAKAIVAKDGAEASNIKADGAYTAGLLHNLGALGLMSGYPEEYGWMLEVSGDCGFDLIHAEREVFEIDHCAAGAYLAEEWNFPYSMIMAIATHHEEPTRASTLSGLIQISWRLADVLGYAAFPSDVPRTYDELVGMIPGASESRIGAGIDEATQQVASQLASFRLS